MAVQITIPIDDATFERAHAAATARGMTVDAYVTDLVRQFLPPAEPAVKGDVSSIFGLVKDGEPTNIAEEIAKGTGRPIGETAQEEPDNRTRW